MNEREKVKQIYNKYGIKVQEDDMNKIMKDKERVENIVKLYKKEEIESMNYILGKSEDNEIFTKFELEAMNKINLSDRKIVNLCKIIWDNKDNPEQLEKFEKQIQEELKKKR